MNDRTDDGAMMVLCGVRESRKSCAFHGNRATVHYFCLLCEHKILLAAASLKQIELFRSTAR